MESFIRTANVCGVASATAFQRAEPAAAHLPRMVRELLLRLRLQGGSSATEMRFKREGAGAAFKQQNGCVQRPIGCSGGGVHRATRGSELIFGKNMEYDDGILGGPPTQFQNSG